MDWLAPFVEKFGFPAALLVLISIGLWKITLFVGRKLFDDDTGFVTVLVKEHLAMLRDHRTAMANILTSAERTVTMLVAVQTGLTELSTNIGVDTEKYETTKTNPALLKLAFALRIMANAYGVNIDNEVERIKEILEGD